MRSECRCPNLTKRFWMRGSPTIVPASPSQSLTQKSCSGCEGREQFAGLRATGDRSRSPSSDGALCLWRSDGAEHILAKYEETIHWIAWNPEAFPKKHGPVRRALLKQSYYIVYFFRGEHSVSYSGRARRPARAARYPQRAGEKEAPHAQRFAFELILSRSIREIGECYGGES